jgi:site-specific DNA-adenine methylase
MFTMTEKIYIPYKGSKNKIAEQLILEMKKQKPKAKIFIDLFGGGGAMSFIALQMGFDKVIYNEYDSSLYNFIDFIFKRIKNNEQSKFGLFPEKYYEFANKETFDYFKNTDTLYAEFLRIIYSFGNNRKDYLFSDFNGEIKKHAHNFVVFDCETGKEFLKNHFKDSYYWLFDSFPKINDWIKKRKIYTNIVLKIEAIRVTKLYSDKVYNYFKNLSFEEFHKLSNMEIVHKINELIPDIPKKNYTCVKNKKLSELQQLQQLERLQQLEQLELINKSYINVDLDKYRDEDIIIYCDPPYRNTDKYLLDFDYGEFDKWAINNEKTIFVSEYTMPDDFREIFTIEKRSSFSSNSNKLMTIEKLYSNKINNVKNKQLNLFQKEVKR